MRFSSKRWYSRSGYRTIWKTLAYSKKLRSTSNRRHRRHPKRPLLPYWRDRALAKSYLASRRSGIKGLMFLLHPRTIFPSSPFLWKSRNQCNTTQSKKSMNRNPHTPSAPTSALPSIWANKIFRNWQPKKHQKQLATIRHSALIKWCSMRWDKKTYRSLMSPKTKTEVPWTSKKWADPTSCYK